MTKTKYQAMVIHCEYTNFGNFTDIIAISQEFSDCGLHMTNIQKISPLKIVGVVPPTITEQLWFITG